MEMEARLTKAAADMVKQQDESRKALAAATAAAVSAPPGTAPAAAAGVAAASAAAVAGMGPDGTPLANGDAHVSTSMRRQVTGLMQQISASAPGYARMLQDSIMGPGGHAAAAAGLGGPEHVPGQEARVGVHAGHPQETELERKTRELQVRGLLAPRLGLSSMAESASLACGTAAAAQAVGYGLVQCLRRSRHTQVAKVSAVLIASDVSSATQAKQQQLIQEKRKQEEERLLVALAQPMGFHKGKPLAALVVFRACLQWRAFQADRTSVFDRIIQVGWGVLMTSTHNSEYGLSACYLICGVCVVH